LWPLMRIDRLQTAYTCSLLIYLSILNLRGLLLVRKPVRGFFDQYVTGVFLPWFSIGIWMLLHFLELVVTVPKHKPDLFAVLWSVVGCGCFGFAWLVTCWHLFRSGAEKEKVI
jgi:hypothetical protein